MTADLYIKILRLICQGHCKLYVLFRVFYVFCKFVLCTLSIVHLCAIDTRLINATCLLTATHTDDTVQHMHEADMRISIRSLLYVALSDEQNVKTLCASGGQQEGHPVGYV